MPSESAKADTAANNAVFRSLRKTLSHSGLCRHNTEEALYDAMEEPLRACGKASFMVRKRLFRTTAKPVPHAGTVIMTHKNGSPMCPKSRFQLFQSTEACRWKHLRRLTTRFPSHCLFSFENFRCKDFLLPETHIYSLPYILMPCQEAACSITRVPFTHALTPPPPCRLRCQRSARGTYVRSSMTLL